MTKIQASVELNPVRRMGWLLNWTTSKQSVLWLSSHTVLRSIYALRIMSQHILGDRENTGLPIKFNSIRRIGG
jgi:hypothetical protein